MNFKEFLLLIASILSSGTGQLFLKLGALKLGQVTTNSIVGHILSIVIVPELLLGLACYAIGAIAYILLLTRVNLSVAGPSAALIYVFSVLVGHFIFNESIPIYRLFGLSFIVCGVILIVWQR